MSVVRRTSLVSGTLFIAALVAVLAAGAFEPDFAGPNYLSELTASSTQLNIAALLHLLAAGLSVGIAVALYPLLKQQRPALALGALAFRIVEAVMYAVAAIAFLAVLPLGHKYTDALPGERAPFEMMADSVLGIRDHIVLVGVLSFGVGALLYYVAFHQTRLVPRWLSGWGVVAALLIMTACLLALFSGNHIETYTFLILPILLQEQVLGVWLLIKGLRVRAGAHPADPVQLTNDS